MGVVKIETKGICLLCLTDLGREHEKHCYPKSTSLKMLVQFLKINVLSHLSVVVSSASSEHGGEVVGLLCDKCCDTCIKFSEVYAQFEKVKVELENWGKELCRVIQEGEGDQGKVAEYERRLMGSRDPAELINASIAENLRRTAAKKCSLGIEVSFREKPEPVEALDPNEFPPLLKPEIPFREIPEEESVETFQNEEFEEELVVIKEELEPIAPLEGPDFDESIEPPEEEGLGDLEGPVVTLPPKEAELDKLTATDEAPIAEPEDTEFPKDSEEEPMVPLDVDGAEPKELEQDPLQLESTSEQEKTPFAFERSHYDPEYELGKVKRPGRTRCTTCGKYVNRKHLLTHVHLHSDQNPWKCSFCGRSFRQRCHLRRHRESDHTMEEFSKSLPPHTTNDQFNATIDVILWRKKTDSKDKKMPHGCPQCNNWFARLRELKAHILRLHFDLVLTTLEKQKTGKGGGGRGNNKKRGLTKNKPPSIPSNTSVARNSRKKK